MYRRSRNNLRYYTLEQVKKMICGCDNSTRFPYYACTIVYFVSFSVT